MTDTDVEQQFHATTRIPRYRCTNTPHRPT